MSKKDVILENQKKLTEVQLVNAKEVQDHLIKAQSMLQLISSSIEAKNADNKLEISDELNSLVAVYDQLDHANDDIEEVIKALEGISCMDEKDD
ncbi:MAG: hypothetical protein HUJ54_01455 [Erysipelotrichaceae bacterium]|nr:hypothetical protein [Erysipelotrichaceae bacterium]